jgi:uncharacterized protein DUF4389
VPVALQAPIVTMTALPPELRSAVSIHPVRFEVDYVERRSRLSTCFRLLLAIPHFIVLALYGLVAFVAVVVAWFVLVFTARWPHALYDVIAGYLRWNARLNAYTFLLTDPYPPFDGDEHPEYPARLAIGPPKPSYNRLKALFRIVLAIPMLVVVYVLQLVAEIVAIVSWFVIVITGRQPAGLQSALRFAVSFSVRSFAYVMLVTEEWPSFADDRPEQAPAPAVHAS